MDFFALDHSGYIRLEGRIATPAGAPLEGARVEIEHQYLGRLGDVTADAGGRFTRDGWSIPGRYRFNARTPDGRAGQSQWFEVRDGRKPIDVRVDPGNGVTIPASRLDAAISDLSVHVGDGRLVGEGIPSGRVFGVDLPALLSDRGIDIAAAVARLVGSGVTYVRTQATVPRPGSRSPQSNWFISPHREEEYVEWREIRDTRLAALMRAGIRVQLDLFDDPAAVHSATHLALRSPDARLAVNAWGGAVPSPEVVRSLANHYLNRLPREVKRGLLVGAARDLRLAGFDRAWFGPLASKLVANGISNAIPIPLAPSQTTDLPREGNFLQVPIAPDWIDGTRLPASKRREVTDYFETVQRGSPGSHLMLNTAGVGAGFIEQPEELARAVWDFGCSVLLATPETPDAWSEVSLRVVAAIGKRLGATEA